jgi:hypothetical protein
MTYSTMTVDKQFRVMAQKVFWNDPVWDVGAHYQGSAFYYTLKVDDKLMRELGFHVNDLKTFLQDLPKTVPAICQAMHVWESELGWLDPSGSGDPRRAGMALAQILQNLMTHAEMLVHTCRHPEAAMRTLNWLQQLKQSYPRHLPSPMPWTLKPLDENNQAMPDAPEKAPNRERAKVTPKPPFDPSVIEANRLGVPLGQPDPRAAFLNEIMDYYNVAQLE